MKLEGIMNLLRNKDLKTQRLLYDMFYKHVYKTGYFITKDSHLAQDVVQETFIKAFCNLKSLNDGEKVGSWLSVIATRTAIDIINKKDNRNVTLVDTEIIEKQLNKLILDTTEEESLENKKEVWDKVDELSPEYRAVIILKYLEDMKQEDISSVLRISLGTVKSRLYRAKSKLRTSFKNSSDYGGDAL